MTFEEKKDLIADFMSKDVDVDRDKVRAELDGLNAAEIQRHYSIFVLEND